MATNQITITFTPCSPAPAGGYRVFYRPDGNVGPYREYPTGFTSSPIVFTDELDPPDQIYEGYLISNCGGGVFGDQVPFVTTLT